MKQFQGTFERYEKKYTLNEIKYEKLKTKIKDKLILDPYGNMTICNIYFDTPNHQLIRSSLDSPVYKEKLRLRSYGVPNENEEVFVEIKKKYKGVVYKRREKMQLAKAKNYLYDCYPIEAKTQIIKEIDWLLMFYKEIIPSMYISYNRIALIGVDDPNLRITFDRNILWREEDLYLEAGIFGNPLLKKGDVLMEIKIPFTMPIWLSHILDELEIYPTSFSKYGMCYKQSQLLRSMTKLKKEKGEIKYA